MRRNHSMVCPRCAKETRVVNSSDSLGGSLILRNVGVKGVAQHRRRQCKDCSYRFTTFEVTETALVQLAESRRDYRTIIETIGRAIKNGDFADTENAEVA